jgi:molybdopterin molybdotransferase
MISVEEATRKLLSGVKPLGVEEVAVLRSLGRVLREDIRSPFPIPPFHKAAMDGYAVRSVDLAPATEALPVELKVLEDIPAGTVGRYGLKKGTAARIMTGAPLPTGADAVVMVEHTERTAGGVRVWKNTPRGTHVARMGEDVRKGQRILPAGESIRPAAMGMIAATGRSRVKVAIRPRVAVLSTGSEVTAPGSERKPGGIFDANGFSLTGLAAAHGAEARFLGIAPDRKGALEKKIESARDADVLILSGGVSVGDYDLVQDILLGMGVKRLFWKVRIKPGRPVFAGRLENRFLLGLPGNPVSCMVTFELFVRPLLDLLLGRKKVGARRGKACIIEGGRFKPGRRKYLRGRVYEMDGRVYVRPHTDQESGVLRSMVESDVLVDIAEEVERLHAGALVDILYLE